MRYLSVCSGIEAATCAWHPLGWTPVAFAEIEAFPSAVLKHHYPDVPNMGDFTKIEAADVGAVDLLVGGTPCQSFSVAGKRLGLDDPRGNLAIEYLALARRLGVRWLVWENVPGVLSSSGGRDFGAFLGILGECGYGFAYRVLDAQYFGLAQRRQRVFVVGHLGDWRPAAAVLLEREGLRGDPPPRRGAREGVAAPIAAGSPSSSGYRNDADTAENLIAQCVTTGTGRRYDAETETLIAHTLRGEGHDASEDGAGRGVPLVAAPIRTRPYADNASHESQLVPIAFNARQDPTHGDVTDVLGTKDTGHGVQTRAQVRRLTPRECERLQGFPDDYTRIPWRRGIAPDGPRYKALGNSMAVPVMAWIGKRIAMVDAVIRGRQAA